MGNMPSHDDLRGLKAIAKSYARVLDRLFLINTGFQGEKDGAECILPFDVAWRLMNAKEK
jgi:hypothetical protein